MTRRFAFSSSSSVQPPPTQGADIPPYLDYLRATLPPTWSADPAHIRLIAEALDAVDRGEIDRLAIHMPPRHGKSETVTIRYPLRYLEHHPTDNVLVTGYNERFARKFGRRTRNLAKSRGLVASDKSAADEWEMTSGGLYMARGVGSPPTGTGFRRIVIDDPIRRREDAESEIYREKVWDWYTDDLYTRLEPGGAIILVMTLWHEDDIGARAVASEPGRWHVLKLPAIAEDADDALGRPMGAALWPERYTTDDLERIRGVLVQNEGERSWQALYQQRPTARKGNLFKLEWFEGNRYLCLPKLRDVCTFWDTALKDGEQNDETAGITTGVGVEDGYLYILRVIHGRWETPDVAKKLIAQADHLKRLFGDEYRGDYVEDKQSGTTLMQYVRRERPDLALIPISVEVDKVTRAHGVTPICEAGRVRFPDGTAFPVTRVWVGSTVTQLTGFPLAKHDDIVDAFVYAIKRFIGTLGRKRSRRGKTGGMV